MLFRLVALILFLAGIINSCTPKLEQRFAAFADVEMRAMEEKESFGFRGNDCRDPLAYSPDTNNLAVTPMKYVRLNIHFVNSEDSTQNYLGPEAIKFAEGLVHACNYDLRKNKKMLLPIGNKTPVLPTRFRYVLTGRPDDPNDKGVYFHFDDELYYYVHKGENANLYDRTVINKYGVQLDTVLNLFIMPHHPDSIASPTYSAFGVGVALGSAMKVAGLYENKGSYWDYRTIINHETGHIFGLGHTWAYNDGCDDTPRNPGCWSNSLPPPCDTLATNNVMDYNAAQNAWTPCQIGKAHYRMANPSGRQRKLLVPTWCELKEESHVFIRENTEWSGMRDLEGHLTITAGAELTIRCRVSLPKAAKITVQPGATLILDNCQLHNDCGEEWEGIELQKAGDQEGKLVFVGAPAVENVRNPLQPGS